MRFSHMLAAPRIEPPPVGAGRVHTLAVGAENATAKAPRKVRREGRWYGQARRRAAVLQAIADGVKTITDIAICTDISRSCVQDHITALISEKKIAQSPDRKGDGYHFRVVTADLCSMAK